MFPRSRRNTALVVLLVFVLSLVVVSAASAGGWVVITLDQLPGDMVVNVPVTVGMLARQHGSTPWEVESLRVEARHAETGETLSFDAKPDQTPGHYQAELLFPEPGVWEWGVSAGMMPALQPMPALRVSGSAGAAGVGQPGAAPLAGLPPVAFGGLALVSLAALVALIARAPKTRYSWGSWAGLALLALVVGGLAFAFFTSANAETAQAPASAVAGMDAESKISLGQKLFLAKGCVVCHTNDRAVQGSAKYGINFGPNLTRYSSDPEYLHAFLKDPRSVRPGGDMPDLGLKLVEIEALISFLNDEAYTAE